MPGIEEENIVVNLERDAFTVGYDASLVALEDMYESILELGYSPGLQAPDNSDSPSDSESDTSPIESALAIASQENKLVLVDFSAEWCIACKVLEEQVFTDATVIEALENYVFIAVDTDEFPEWLQDVSEEIPSIAGEAEVASQDSGEGEIDDIPAWIQDIAEEETPVEEETLTTELTEDTSQPEIEDVDAAMAWLESLAAKQGVSEDELLTSPEERSDLPPEWIQATSDVVVSTSAKDDAETDIEELFASKAAVDLYYDIVRPKMVWPTRDFSIKTLATFLGFEWRDQEPSGAASIEWYHRWVDTRDLQIRQRILDYNEDDCLAMRILVDAVRSMSVLQPTDSP